MVLGHEHCGALTSSIKGVKLGNITSVLEKIQPVIAEVNKSFIGEKSAYNSDYVEEVCKLNVANSIKEIRTNSPILAEMEENQEIKIVGAVYDMKEGRVTFL